MSLYPAAPGYYDRIYPRCDIYGAPTIFGGNADEKSIGDWSMGIPTGNGLGFSTSGPYGMMMTPSYEPFRVLPPPSEVEMANTQQIVADFMGASGDRGSARLKPEPKVVGGEAEVKSTGSEITAAAADTSGDDAVKEKAANHDGGEVDTAAHVFAPDSDRHGPERHCLLWACKTCKKRSAAAVDRRKVYVALIHDVYRHSILQQKIERKNCVS